MDFPWTGASLGTFGYSTNGLTHSIRFVIAYFPVNIAESISAASISVIPTEVEMTHRWGKVVVIDGVVQLVKTGRRSSR